MIGRGKPVCFGRVWWTEEEKRANDRERFRKLLTFMRTGRLVLVETTEV
jgi:hypothetical protein